MYYLLRAGDKYIGYVLTMDGKKFIDSSLLPSEPYVAWILPEDIIFHLKSPDELARIILSNMYCFKAYMLEFAPQQFVIRNTIDFNGVKLNEYTIAGYKFYSRANYPSGIYIDPKVVSHNAFIEYYGTCCGSLYKGKLVDLVLKKIKTGIFSSIKVYDIFYNGEYITTCGVDEDILMCLERSQNLKILDYEVLSEILCKYSQTVGLWT